MQLGQSSGGESGERLLVVYLDVEWSDGVDGKMGLGGEAWRVAAVSGGMRAEGSMRCCPGRPGCPGTNWSNRRAVAMLSTRQSSSMVSRLYW